MINVKDVIPQAHQVHQLIIKDEEKINTQNEENLLMKGILISLVRTETKYLVINSGMGSNGLLDQILQIEKV